MDEKKELSDEQKAKRKDAQAKYRSSHKSFNFRLSNDEAEKLKARVVSSGMSAQDFYKRAILEKPLVDKEMLKQLLTEIKKEGVNLNQIAHNLNAEREVDSQRIIDEVLKLKTLQEELWQFLKQ